MVLEQVFPTGVLRSQFVSGNAILGLFDIPGFLKPLASSLQRTVAIAVGISKTFFSGALPVLCPAGTPFPPVII